MMKSPPTVSSPAIRAFPPDNALSLYEDSDAKASKFPFMFILSESYIIIIFPEVRQGDPFSLYDLNI